MTTFHDPSTCPRCGKQFHCSKSGRCWCYEVHLPMDVLEFIEEHYESCLCPACLMELSHPRRDPEGKISIESLIKLPYRKKQGT